jgi:arsenate reductase-like glutaredoxin family protein
MSDVIAVRVSKKLKDELQELNVNYAEDIREYLERRVKAEKLKQVIKEIDAFRNELGKKTGITESSADIIREDRDHGH